MLPNIGQMPEASDRSIAPVHGGNLTDATETKSEADAGGGRFRKILQSLVVKLTERHRKMALCYTGVGFVLLLLAIGTTSWALANESQGINVTDTKGIDVLETSEESSEGRSKTLESRNDLPDLDDETLKSFFDFSNIEDDSQDYSYDDSTTESFARPNNNYIPPRTYNNYRHPYPSRPKYPYYYAKHPYNTVHRKYVKPPPYAAYSPVTPGTHFKMGNNFNKFTTNELDQPDNTSNRVVVGPYQVSVVGANSPYLSSLGLKKHHLEKMSGSQIPTRQSIDLTVSDSAHSPTYAAYPGPYSPPARNPYTSSESSSSYHHHSSSDYQRPSYSRPTDYPQSPSRPYSVSTDHVSSATYKHPSAYHSPVPHQASYSSEPWRPNTPTSSNDYHTSKVQYEHELRKPDPNYNRGLLQPPNQLYPPHPPPLPYKNPPEPPRHTYSAPPPQSVSTTYHSKDSNTYAKPSYHQQPYSSYSSSTSSNAPARAGSANYDSYHQSSHYEQQQPSSKPIVTVRFKAKTPSAGLTIPINFNPLEVVKKLTMPLAALNPLANKKVTIGITIENKNSQSEPLHVPVHHY